ncbi:hypothetical protein T265_12015, partial [Opisthorchis viverrini]
CSRPDKVARQRLITISATKIWSCARVRGMVVEANSVEMLRQICQCIHFLRCTNTRKQCNDQRQSGRSN